MLVTNLGCSPHLAQAGDSGFCGLFMGGLCTQTAHKTVSPNVAIFN
jgi:hypothetical protein